MFTFFCFLLFLILLVSRTGSPSTCSDGNLDIGDIKLDEDDDVHDALADFLDADVEKPLKNGTVHILSEVSQILISVLTIE